MSVDPSYIPGQRRPGFGTVVFISMLTSSAVSVLTVALLLRYGSLAGAAGLFPPAAQHESEPAVDARLPDVVNMSAEAADELLSARKLRLVVKERRAHPTVVAGAVISQTPLAQSRIGPGGEVSVVLSTGPARTQIPDLVGQPLEQAKAGLAAAGLHLGPITESDAPGEPGSVVATSPGAGTALDPGASVGLTVARAAVEVPKLVGLHSSKARERITKAGLTVGNVSEIYDEHRRGYLVLSQDPEAGTHLPAGGKVNLVVNQGD
jgi:beta-lactam-binding protein with PASTA domain